jgi:hypothetical protein
MRRSRSHFAVATCLVLTLVAAILVASSASAQLNQPLHRDGWILAAVHAPGLHGSIWRTDLWLYADTLSGQNVTLKLCRSGQDNTAAAEFAITAAPGQKVLYIEDVVDNATNDAYFVRGIKTMEFQAP